MKRRTLLCSAICLGAVAILPACNASGHELPTYRYRLTVEVDTPEGLKSGSSVIEVRTELAGKVKLPDANGLRIEFKGEAVAVDLGPRGVLFALLRSESSVSWAGGVMERVTPPPPAATKVRYAKWHARMLANKGVHALHRISPFTLQPWERPKPDDPPKDYPMLVRFGDITDPKTVERVNPDDLAASFGSGVKLRRITVELTDDPVTTGIEKRLEWLSRHPEPSLNPSHGPTDFSISATLHHGDFRYGN